MVGNVIEKFELFLTSIFVLLCPQKKLVHGGHLELIKTPKSHAHLHILENVIVKLANFLTLSF